MRREALASSESGSKKGRGSYGAAASLASRSRPIGRHGESANLKWTQINDGDSEDMLVNFCVGFHLVLRVRIAD